MSCIKHVERREAKKGGRGGHGSDCGPEPPMATLLFDTIDYLKKNFMIYLA
jgi:hypothetical protein